MLVEVFVDVFHEDQHVAVQNHEVVFAVQIVDAGKLLFNRRLQPQDRMLVAVDFVGVAVMLGEDHPSEVLRQMIGPLMDAVVRDVGDTTTVARL